MHAEYEAPKGVARRLQALFSFVGHVATGYWIGASIDDDVEHLMEILHRNSNSGREK